MPRMWQPTLWYKSPRTKTVTTFGFGKRGDSARHVRYHRTNVRQTTRKFTFGGDLFDVKKLLAGKARKRQKSLL